jgi:hypothetical protein
MFVEPLELFETYKLLNRRMVPPRQVADSSFGAQVAASRCCVETGDRLQTDLLLPSLNDLYCILYFTLLYLLMLHFTLLYMLYPTRSGNPNQEPTKGS